MTEKEIASEIIKINLETFRNYTDLINKSKSQEFEDLLNTLIEKKRQEAEKSNKNFDEELFRSTFRDPLKNLPRLFYHYNKNNFLWIGINPSLSESKAETEKIMKSLLKNSTYLFPKSNANILDDLKEITGLTDNDYLMKSKFHLYKDGLNLDSIIFKIMTEIDERYVQRVIKHTYFKYSHDLLSKINNLKENQLEFQNIDLFPLRNTKQSSTTDILDLVPEYRNKCIELFFKFIEIINPKLIIIGNAGASNYIHHYLQRPSTNFKLDDAKNRNLIGLDYLIKENQSLKIPVIFFRHISGISKYSKEIFTRFVIQNYNDLN